MPGRTAPLVAALVLAACAGPALKPAVAPVRPPRDALLILPGFGYGRGDDRAFRAVALAAAADGIDTYVAAYLTRGGLESSRRSLDRFIRNQRLDRYERLHVFAFLAGGWTINPLLDRAALPNLRTVVYDRSPFQERAPIVAVSELRLPAWLRFGSTIFDVARTPYPALTRPGVRIGMIVETRPTAFVRRRKRSAAALGPWSFSCDAFNQRYDDCAFVAMSHDELYEQFARLWPDLEAFIRGARFTEAATRVPPADPARILGTR